MKKRYLVIGLSALLIVVAGTWGVLSVRPRSAQTSSGNAHATNVASLHKTGTDVIPTVNISNSTAKCDPKHIPGVGSDPAHGIGEVAIKPHLCSIPTFTEQDVRQYMRTVTRFTGIRIRQASPDYMITRILFITNGVANDPNGLNADTGPSDPNLIVCYIEVYGNFTVKTVSGSSGILHHGEMVFDGVTGNILVTGVKL